MDDRGRIIFDPSEEQIKKKKLVRLNENDMKIIREMDEDRRKKLYQQKVLARKKNGPYGINYFQEKSNATN